MTFYRASMVTLITYFELQDAIIDQYQLPSALIIEKDIIYYGHSSLSLKPVQYEQTGTKTPVSSFTKQWKVEGIN